MMKIKKERTLIWIKATFIAILASVLFARYGKNLVNITGSYSRSCMNTLIFYMVQYMVYSLHPKSDWMLNHVDNNEQAKAWLEKYKYMKNKWHMGAILGIAGYFFVALYYHRSRTLV